MSDSSKNPAIHCCAPGILPAENKQERNLRQLTEALLAERLKAAQKKNEPHSAFTPGKSRHDWHQHLRNMRAEAVARGFVSPDEPNPFDNY